MWADDHAARWFGFVIVEVAEGTATLSLDVDPHHCNGHGIVHGGLTFSLADTAFAYACNSRNQRSVAHANTITFVAPGHAGDRLTAKAREVCLSGRTGIYDVTVTRQDGTTIAEFRGQSRAIPGTLVDDAEGETRGT